MSSKTPSQGISLALMVSILAFGSGSAWVVLNSENPPTADSVAAPGASMEPPAVPAPAAFVPEAPAAEAPVSEASAPEAAASASAGPESEASELPASGTPSVKEFSTQPHADDKETGATLAKPAASATADEDKNRATSPDAAKPAATSKATRSAAKSAAPAVKVAPRNSDEPARSTAHAEARRTPAVPPKTAQKPPQPAAATTTTETQSRDIEDDDGNAEARARVEALREAAKKPAARARVAELSTPTEPKPSIAKPVVKEVVAKPLVAQPFTPKVMASTPEKAWVRVDEKTTVIVNKGQAVRGLGTYLGIEGGSPKFQP